MAKLIEKTYGDALFLSALENHKVDELKEEADAVRAVFADNADLIKLLNHPDVIKEEKIQVLENIFKGRISGDMLGFLLTVIEKDRHMQLAGILGYFDELVMEYRHIGRCFVKSAMTLSEEQKAKIEKKLLDTTAYESFEMNYQVDEGLLGGVVIRIGDCVVDGSVKGKLNRLTKELENVKLA